jgi:hypothetical protein
MLKARSWQQELYCPNNKLENDVPFNVSVFTSHLNTKIIILGKWKMQHNKDNDSCYMIINLNFFCLVNLS